MRTTITSPAGKPILLYRPMTRRRLTQVAVGAAVVGGLAAGVVIVPQLPVLLGHYTETGIPTVQGAEAIDPMAEAIESHREAHGRFPADIVELEHTEGSAFHRTDHLMYRVTSNPDGSAYIAGSVGVTGDYSAVVGDADGLVGSGEGATFLEALQAAGWTPEWADEHAFQPMASVEKHYGDMAVTATTVTKLTLDIDTGQYTATVTPVPRSGSGADWEAAAEAAGADPTLFTVNTTLTDEPTVVHAADKSATLTLVSDGAEVDARVDYAPKGKGTGTVLEPVLAQAGIDSIVFANANGVFTCATATSVDTIDSATVCQGAQGGRWAYATTGSAAADSQYGTELGDIGATPAWAQEHGLSLPTYDDLF